MVGLLGRVISPSQGLYLHRKTQHRKTWTNIHALSGIRTHNPSNQPANTHASDRTATVTGILHIYLSLFVYRFINLLLTVIHNHHHSYCLLSVIFFCSIHVFVAVRVHFPTLVQEVISVGLMI
jgi:hypothetical protein